MNASPLHPTNSQESVFADKALLLREWAKVGTGAD